MTKRLVALAAGLAAGLAAAASFAMPSSASASPDTVPCWVGGVLHCLGSTGDDIQKVLDSIRT